MHKYTQARTKKQGMIEEGERKAGSRDERKDARWVKREREREKGEGRRV